MFTLSTRTSYIFCIASRIMNLSAFRFTKKTNVLSYCINFMADSVMICCFKTANGSSASVTGGGVLRGPWSPFLFFGRYIEGIFRGFFTFSVVVGPSAVLACVTCLLPTSTLKVIYLFWYQNYNCIQVWWHLHKRSKGNINHFK